MNLKSIFFEIDTQISKWARHNSIYLLRFSLAVVFIWFGLNKVLTSAQQKS